ncbi:FxSxx-COOH system tetratricopeptide repeat protein [Streptomyces sp. NBC_00829]|uniref:FxSxx-COOH system tetratricopeptide repeat protein n=1 Tax=Streptomyces sp. NBC_00829 TaxID=2903679 RepID=UPI003868AB38|nr:FxSxx-COOH system tetratricopeptide repeat protein [Streptomyces sp. NBC_00829]
MTGEDAGRIITFYSYKGGTGRTMALANTAWIMASSGKRVLVVDWDLDAPGLDRFLHPFLDRDKLLTTPGVIDLVTRFSQSLLEEQRLSEAQYPGWGASEQAPAVNEEWVAERARFNHCVIPVIWDFPENGRLDFLPAGTKTKGYLSAFSQFDWKPFMHGPLATEFIESLKREFVRNYDYVLIDSRTGLSDISDICTVNLPHTLVTCFTPSSQSIDGAAAVVERIEAMYSNRNIRILPVPMRVEDTNGQADRLDAARAQIRLRFARILGRHCSIAPHDYWGRVEIPYRPAYSYEELLAPFRDTPGSHSSLLAAYERLTEVVSDGEVISMPRMEEGLRQRYLDLYTRRRPLDVSDVYISYVPQDRTWADWIRAVLEGAEFRVHLAQEGTDEGSRLKTETERGVESTSHTLTVMSAAYLRSSRFRTTWETVFSPDRLGNRRHLVPVRIEEVPLNAPFTDRLVDLTRCDTDDVARETLLRAFDAPSEPQPRAHFTGADRLAPRYPGAEPPVWSVPLRTTSFTGRTELLETIRERLRTGNQAILLRGMGGVGKTLLAQEFAHRYKGDYDIVWHIQAEQRNLAVEQYAAMARPLRLAERKNPTDAARAVRDALDLGEPYHRWLLILDNADEAGSLTDFLARGRSGHVLVTSQRSEGWSKYAETVEVGVFSRQESISHLRRRLPDCGPEEANLVADALGDLPIAVEQAAAGIKQTGLGPREYIRLLQRPTAGTEERGEGDQVADFNKATGGTWDFAIGRLRENYPPAVRLLQLCSYFSPEPISMDLLEGIEIARALGGGRTVARAYQELSRFALVRVDRKARSVQVHRLVQLSMRHSMTEQEQEDAREVVYRALVAARPGKDDPEDPNTWDQYRIIWPHLGTPWSLSTPDDGVRELIVDRVRQLRRRGEFAQAMELSERCVTGWCSDGDPDERWTLHMRFQIANILRAQGKYEESLALDEEVLERQLSVFGDKDDQHVLMTTSSIAADLRGLGRFSEALAYDRETHQRYSDVYGEDHPRTLTAANNLAVSLRASGDYYAACDLDRKTFETREEILLPDHPLTIESAVNLGRDLRDCGDYGASVSLLKRAHERCLRNVELTEGAPTVLNTVKGLAGSLRGAGRPAEAEQFTRNVLSHTPEVEGGDSPDRLLLEMNLASDLMALNREDEALELVRRVHDGLRHSLGEEHPSTVACSANYAVHLLGAGRAVEAEALSEQAVRAFTGLLGDSHPHVLVSRVNLANAQAERGRRKDARKTYESVFDQLREVLRSSHPSTLVCAGNLAVLLRELGDSSVAESMRDEVLAEMSKRLGADHPRTAALHSWGRTGLELEPHPI